jgi:hypothetical protein
MLLIVVYALVMSTWVKYTLASDTLVKFVKKFKRLCVIP